MGSSCRFAGGVTSPSKLWELLENPVDLSKTVPPERFNIKGFFHPDGERGPARARRQAAAKAVCGTCPVIDACLQHALSVREPYGVWGGLTEDERRVALRSDRGVATPETGAVVYEAH